VTARPNSSHRSVPQQRSLVAAGRRNG
jgi:hypothetical protein